MSFISHAPGAKPVEAHCAVCNREIRGVKRLRDHLTTTFIARCHGKEEMVYFSDLVNTPAIVTFFTAEARTLAAAKPRREHKTRSLSRRSAVRNSWRHVR